MMYFLMLHAKVPYKADHTHSPQELITNLRETQSLMWAQGCSDASELWVLV